MEAALAAMAAHTILSFQAPLSSSFPLPPPPQYIALPLTSKKAVALLKGSSSVQGIVTLIQQDNGMPLPTLPFFPSHRFNHLFMLCL